MRVSAQRRRQAILQAGDTRQAVQLGVAVGLRHSSAAVREALTAYRKTGDPAAAYKARWMRVVDDMGRAMTLSRLRGLWRSRFITPGIPVALASNVYEGAVQALRRRLKLPAAKLDAIEEQFRAHAFRVAQEVSAETERKLQRALIEITRRGEHVREGVKRLRAAFDAAGVTPANSFSVEATFRTQTSLAYAAGKIEAERGPDVEPILWGYEYVTVGDDRVRPNHAAMDGVRMPKDAAIWQTWYPPCGWACRCQVIAIYEPEELRPPQPEVEINGKPTKPGPDDGFAWIATDLFGTGTAQQVQPARTPKPSARVALPAKPAEFPDPMSIVRSHSPSTGAELRFAEINDATPWEKRERETTEAAVYDYFQQLATTDRDAYNAIAEYTDEWFEDIRSTQAGRTSGLDSQTIEGAKQHLAGLERAYQGAAKFRGTVYRGFSETKPGMGFDEHLKPGTVLALDSWTSSSASRAVAAGFQKKYMLEIRKTSLGMYVDPISSMKGEYEVLLPKGTQYRIIGLYDHVTGTALRSAEAVEKAKSVRILAEQVDSAAQFAFRSNVSYTLGMTLPEDIPEPQPPKPPKDERREHQLEARLGGAIDIRVVTPGEPLPRTTPQTNP